MILVPIFGFLQNHRGRIILPTPEKYATNVQSEKIAWNTHLVTHRWKTPPECMEVCHHGKGIKFARAV